jgi:SAM-dependent methyltransferase
MDKTSLWYVKRKTPCSTTPTFRHVQPYAKGRVLDIGVATGEYLEKFASGSVGIDVSEINVSFCKNKGLDVQFADINQGIPFSDNLFDSVFCSHVIEHVESPLRLIQEAYRVVVPNGHVIFGVPIEKTLVHVIKEGYYEGHEGHLYGLSPESMTRLLKQANLIYVRSYYNFPIVNRYKPIDSILQNISGSFCQYFCTMYWIVGKKSINQNCPDKRNNK